MAVEKYHDTEKLIDLFLQMDTNKDETIDAKEVEAFYKKHGIDEMKLKDWLSKFDLDKNNKITLNEFCRCLGIRPDEMRREKEERQKMRSNQGPKVDAEVKIIASTMSDAKQFTVTEKFKEILKNHHEKEEEMKAVADEIKAFMDQSFERVWQCVILTGSYWMHFSHEPFLSIQFRFGKYICLLWRTPRG